MKTKQLEMISSFFLVFIILMCVITNLITKDNIIKHQYPLSGIVTTIDEATDTVIFEDFNGNEWAFTGIEDYMINDKVSCIMNDNNTIEIFDDKIVTIRYDGYIE